MPDRPSSLIDISALLEMVYLALNTPRGCMVEVGVYQGGSAVYLAAVARARACDLHLFDTFCGIPHAGPNDSHSKGDFANVSLDAVRAAIPTAIFHVGEFPDTLPNDLQDIAFVHCDADQCDSIRAVIKHLWPRMVPGAIIVFDDWDQSGGRIVIEEAFGDRIQHERGRSYVTKPLIIDTRVPVGFI